MHTLATQLTVPKFTISFFILAGKVRMLADTCGEFVKATDLTIDLSAVLGSVRSKRFSMLVEDGKAAKVNIEPDGTGLTCSLVKKLL